LWNGFIGKKIVYQKNPMECESFSEERKRITYYIGSAIQKENRKDVREWNGLCENQNWVLKIAIIKAHLQT
jgi:hypothetical protein